jgi:hypothetical protein
MLCCKIPVQKLFGSGGNLLTFLVDGNNLGHALGFIDKESEHYDGAGLLSVLDGVARYLDDQGQVSEILLFLDDPSAPDRLGGWQVKVARVPDGDADAAIRSYAQQRAGSAQVLVSGDQALCDDVALWGAVCLSPTAFISRYLGPANREGYVRRPDGRAVDLGPTFRYTEIGRELPTPEPEVPHDPRNDQGGMARQRQSATLARAQATLRGEELEPPQVYRLDLSCWSDPSDLAVYLAENHLCPEHPELTAPDEMIKAIREHCSLEPRYFTAGRIVNRVFRLFLCRPEYSLSLDDLTRLAGTRRRKVRSAIQKYGAKLGILVHW